MNNKVGFIGEWVNIEELNNRLSQNKYENTEIMYINTLHGKLEEFSSIDFPVLLKHIYISLCLHNYNFLKDITDYDDILKYLKTDFFDYFKIPFGCSLIIKTNITRASHYEMIFTQDKIIYDNVSCFNKYGTTERTSKLIIELFKDKVKNDYDFDIDLKLHATGAWSSSVLCRL